ncbi:hypothetical protein [Acinetobacter boissieri]|uniref:Uncharacterized protein n=1 Tax=Acinetobacter boissieri TaxID=1219383 RepID=A0A1G6GYA1_9GAMM|nr:hypothetical protein [Acinetobacter boissieri]SDB86858.1 hypothetical protein SAMN05421733_10313 [Acinetobacter boissieri]
MSNLVLDMVLVFAFLCMTLYCMYWKKQHQKSIELTLFSPMLKFMIHRLKWFLMIAISIQSIICLFLDWRLITVLNTLGCEGVSVWFVAVVLGVISMWFSGVYIAFSLLNTIRPKGAV